MNRYELWSKGVFLGRYEGKNHEEAKQACAADNGFLGVEAMVRQLGHLSAILIRYEV